LGTELRQYFYSFSLFLLFFSVCVNADPLGVQPYIVKRQNGYWHKFTFVGRTATERVTDIGFEIAGLVEELPVNDGEQVGKDQVLARLDTSRLLAQQRQLQAERNETIADLQLAQKDLKRSEELVRGDHIGRQVYDQDYARERRLTARLNRLNARLEIIKIDLYKSTIRAAFNATVLQRFVHVGASVQAGQAVIRLQHRNIDEVQIGIPPQFINNLKVGQCYPLTIGDKDHRGCIDKIVHRLSPETQTSKVIFKLRRSAPMFTGQVAKFNFKKFVQGQGFWVPTTALMEGARGTWQIYLLQPQENRNKYKIVTKQAQVIFSDNQRSYIQASVKTNDVIIAEGVHKFVPGQIVEMTGAS